MVDLKNKPTDLDKDAFVETFGGVYEHSPWVAEQVWDAGINADLDTIGSLASTMAAVVARADQQTQLDLINAHPDLAGKAAVSGTLTVCST